MDAKRFSDVARRLLDWYDVHRRVLPWRAAAGARADPYRVWLSEVMLQQTTVAAVRPRFEAWVARWPTFDALAGADEADVMAAWAGLGYYARARNLVAAARVVTAEHGGRLPDTEEALRTLPGLGAYTAAAVAAIAFGRRAVVVDANVERVVARLFAISAKGAGIRAAADSVTPEERAGDFAQAMMDLGSAICTVRGPKCLLCPLREDCAGFASGTPEAFPAKKAKMAKPQRFGTVFWLERSASASVRAEPVEGRPALLGPGRASTGSARTGEGAAAGVGGRREVLLVRRPAKGLLGGMRALPTGAWGDTQPGFADAPAAMTWRLLNHQVFHGFTHFDLQLSLATARAGAHTAHAAGEWWPVDDLESAGLPTVFAKAADAIRRATCEHGS